MPAFNQFLATMSGGQRAEALYAYFGWQGGTVHQLAEATGLTVAAILYEDALDHDRSLASRYSMGWSAIRTCDLAWRRNTLAPKWQGVAAYWHGVMAGYWLYRWKEAA